MNTSSRSTAGVARLGCGLCAAAILAAVPAQAQVTCDRTIGADVVVLDQPLMYNRLGAQNVNGIVYALRRDVVPIPAPGELPAPSGSLEPGKVMLRPDKRPRPLVLRAAAGDCLTIRFQNLLAPEANRVNPPPGFTLPKVNDQVADRMAGFHAQGLEVLTGVADDGSYAGKNASSLVAPGQGTTYRLHAPKEGAFLVTSHGATFGADGSAGNSASGMFAVVNVEPKGARFYRAQVTEEELRLATRGTSESGHPIIDYAAVYPATTASVDEQGQPITVASVWAREGKAGLPVLAMLDGGNNLVHSDLNAMIVGPNPDGSFPPSTYPLESKGLRNPTVPNRLEPFREYTVAFHDEMAVSNAFPRWYQDPVLKHTLHAVGDVFQVNYGSGGVGSEVIANRLGVGPMHDCLDCAYEEFFLTSPAVGDPAMVVDVPANVGLEACAPPGTGAACAAVGPKATRAYYPDDPSNVHHSYIGDFVKIRNVHTGMEHHVFHLHNHQWLFNPNDDNSNYLDAQGIGPGGGYTYEINFGGAGNRNKSAGDAIFHCHFYPHFAQGMWAHWRVHDVLETGTPLAVSAAGEGGFHSTPYALLDGEPALVRVEQVPRIDPATGEQLTDPTTGAPLFDEIPHRARALPDGEVVAGTPIPAVVPLPGKGMPVLPGAVTVVPKVSSGAVVGSVARVDRADVDESRKHAALNPTGLKNPGYPFWIAGIEDAVGQRFTTPPLDMSPAAGGWDGGLPRHALDGYAASGCAANRAECDHAVQTRLDLTKEILKAKPIWYPEDGTDVEKAAMAFHAVREHPTVAVNVTGEVVPGTFVTNGAPPRPGAPYHDPCVDDTGHLLSSGYVGKFFSAVGLGTTGSSPYDAENPRVYKGVNIQFDAVLNKLGYHFSQQRILTLWEDALPTITKQRPAEPLVMRLNTFDCAMYHHTNLVPAVYELDDYQVRTTTDVIGQHMHLPKWDLTTTDGAANGWNYEDGTLSPDAVRERIHAINSYNPSGAGNPADAAGRPASTPLVEQKHPYFPATGPGGASWLGARTTLQRWFSDPVVNVDGQHRGLGIAFSHDHFGPSTHQQIGLYATLLSEPPGSTWRHNETGEALGTRHDGGPTSWQAMIVDGENSHREFFLEYSDFQHAYAPGVYVGRDQWGGLAPPPTPDTFRHAVNPSVRQQLSQPFPDVFYHPTVCPGGVPRPCPEAISADEPGFMVVNYRNEPIGHRVYDPAKLGPDGKKGAQADGLAGDLAYALQSRTDRAIAHLNVWPGAGHTVDGTVFPPPINDPKALTPGDPFTPMIRAHYGDNVRVKIQAGGHEESHNATIYGVKWLQGGSGYGFAPNSGWRNSQHAGISEQFTFASPALPKMNGALKADHLYTTNASVDGFWSGVWGVYRNYGEPESSLAKLPNNSVFPIAIANLDQFNGVCPKTAVNRAYDLTAVLANAVLDRPAGVEIRPAGPSATMHVGGALDPNGGTLVYNPREQLMTGTVDGPNGPETVTREGPLHDPTALMYVFTSDLVPVDSSDPGCWSGKGKLAKLDPTLSTCKVKLRPTACDASGTICTPGAPVEPVVLRAAAGECMNVTLRNRLPAIAPDLAGWKHLPPIVARDNQDPQGVTWFNNNLVRPSSQVGLHPTLVSYDANKDDGVLVGVNGLGNDGKGSFAPPGGSRKYQWYAGDLSASNAGSTFDIVATPVEFGGANLTPADVIKQGGKGLGGAIVVHAPGSTWAEQDLVLDRQGTAAKAADLNADCASKPSACRATRASATVDGVVRSHVVVVQKGMNHRYKDGTPAEMIAAEGGSFAEDAEDSGHMAMNYGSEPMWFRFGLVPSADFGNHGPGSYGAVPNAHQAYSNALSYPGGTFGNPATPVFTSPAGTETRLHLVHPTGSNRTSVLTLHGHVWQRDPYVCPGSAKDGLPGKCRGTGFVPTASGGEVASRGIGVNPVGFATGAQDLVAPGAHFDLVLPSAGGANARRGDYLLMDRSGLGNTAGLWNLLRVE